MHRGGIALAALVAAACAEPRPQVTAAPPPPATVDVVVPLLSEDASADASSPEDASVRASLADAAPPAPPEPRMSGPIDDGKPIPAPTGCGFPASCARVPVDAKASISLERTACFGSCPAYKVTIAADGTITFDGHSSVEILGPGAGHIDPKLARDLIAQAQGACFSSFAGEYRIPVTDMPWANTTLHVGGRSKLVRHYGMASAPPGCTVLDTLDKLENRIDALALPAVRSTAPARSGPSSREACTASPYYFDAKGVKHYKPECLH